MKTTMSSSRRLDIIIQVIKHEMFGVYGYKRERAEHAPVESPWRSRPHEGRCHDMKCLVFGGYIRERIRERVRARTGRVPLGVHVLHEGRCQ
jgi:hypothetical protein